jgi:hypothetical protein
LFGEEEVAEFVCGFEAAVFDQFGEGDAGGSGHVAGGQAGARLGCCAVEAGGGAGVEDLLVVGDFVFELGEILYGFGVEGCVEGCWRAADGAGFDREARFNPGAEASVEEVDLLGAEGAEGPPGSRGRKDALLLVDDDGAVVGDAEGGHAAGEVFGCGQHVGEGGGVVGEFFNVEEEGAGDVLVEVAGAGVDGGCYAYGREGSVEDDGVGILESSGEPGGGDERVHGD